VYSGQALPPIPDEALPLIPDHCCPLGRGVFCNEKELLQ
jgi:hypothetical protein